MSSYNTPKQLLDEGAMEKKQRLAESGIAAVDQENELRKYQTGEKRDLSRECDSPGNLPPARSISSISDGNNLHSPPPSYFGNVPTHSTISNESPGATPSSSVSSVEPSSGDIGNLLIKDLRFETRRQLGLRLDLELTAAANWKSVADEIGFSNLEIQNFDRTHFKTQEVLKETEVRCPQFTVGELCKILRDFDREDVVTDMERWFIRDLRSLNNPGRSLSGTYERNTSHLPTIPVACGGFSGGNSSFFPTTSVIQQPTDSFSPLQDKEISTSGSQPSEYMTDKPPLPMAVNESSSLPEKFSPASFSSSPSMSSTSFMPSISLQQSHPQERQYDAFVLFDAADGSFILDEFLPKVEEQAGIRLFVPARDGDAGEHLYQAQLETMVKKCSKLVVILSDEFLRTPSCQWALNFGVSLDPAARGRKIIPVIYKRITEMSILNGFNACDRTRVLHDSWFWNGVIKSLKKP